MNATKYCGLCKVEKPLSDFYSRKDRKGGLSSACKPCHIAQSNRREGPRLERWRRQNRAAYRDWYVRNREERAAYNRAWRETNKTANAARLSEWGRENVDKVSALRAKRHAAKRKAVAAWGNEFFIQEAYLLAKRRHQLTGIKWHVDHIVPLQSKLVCGLHVENNLRVIPASQNISKLNRYWPSMPC